MLRIIVTLLSILTGAVAVAESNALDISDRRQLFVDASLIERMDGVSLRLHEPVSGGVAIKLEKPWEGPANFGSSVLRFKNRYLMYYRAMTLKEEDTTGILCVATSDDGIEWVKPNLGLVAHDGHRETNIISDDSGRSLMLTPWLDTRPGVADDERIKAFTSEALSGEKHTAYHDPKGAKRLIMWASADGFTFHKLEQQPKIVSELYNCFDGGNTMFWSDAEQAYVLYYRYSDSKRSVARTTSKDFLNWSDHVPMTYGDTPREHIYTNNTMPYFRAPHIYIALAARYMQGRRVLTDAQGRAIGFKSPDFLKTWVNSCADGVLLSTRPGSTQYDRTFMEGFVRPGPGYQNWTSRTNYPLTGIYPFGKDQMMFWVSRHYMQDTWRIERQVLRLDGFASVNAPYAGGEMITKPLTFSGKKLEINYRTSAAGSIRIELQTVDGKPIAGYRLDECPEIIGDETVRRVVWDEGANLAALSSQPIRLRFTLKDADLYSFCFVD